MFQLGNDDIAEIKQRYQETDVVTFPLFTREKAINCRDDILAVPEYKWQFVAKYGDITTKTPHIKQNTQTIVWEWNKVEKFRAIPTAFACRYYQIEEGYEKLLFDEDFIARIKEIIPEAVEIKQLVVMNLSPGCFINAHTDAGRGLAAFVYQLSDNWHPMYGGILHFVDKDIAITPRFNEITIMRTGKEGILHCVTPVADYVTGRRISIAGIIH